jgi:dTDP-L-rhamnose 4-epimerase
MKVLITGGAGFIGSQLALRLVGLGHKVTIIDSLSPQIHGNNAATTSPLYRSLLGRVDFERGCVTDHRLLAEKLGEQDAVVHLAAETGTGQSMYQVRRYSDVNVGGTATLLEALATVQHNVRRLVVASSRAVYGEGKYRSADGEVVYPSGRLISDLSAGAFELYCPRTGQELTPVATDEESKLHPNSVYGITKEAQERLVMTVCPALGIESVALRYQNVFGPGQSLRNPYTGILSIFSNSILNGNAINIFEDGKESRDFVFIDDVVNATCLALFKNEAAGEVFGIGSGVPVTVLRIAELLINKYGREVPVRVTGQYRVGDIRHNFADLAKARRLLGFECKVDFEEGIERFVQWVKQQEISDDAYSQSLDELASRGLLGSSAKK